MTPNVEFESLWIAILSKNRETIAHHGSSDYTTLVVWISKRSIGVRASNLERVCLKGRRFKHAKLLAYGATIAGMKKPEAA